MDNWVLELLSLWRILPAAMFGGQTSVRDLDLFLFAYKSARIAAGLYERDEDKILRDFSVWLCNVRFSRRPASWCEVIRETDPAEDNVNTFFALFEEFRVYINLNWIPASQIPDRWHWHVTHGTHPDWLD